MCGCGFPAWVCLSKSLVLDKYRVISISVPTMAARGRVAFVVLQFNFALASQDGVCVSIAEVSSD